MEQQAWQETESRPAALTEGPVLKSLAGFALPILLSLLLQALYGAVDLLVVGQFAATPDVSGVATGSMLLAAFTNMIAGLSVGLTVLIARCIGAGQAGDVGRAVGSGAAIFSLFGLAVTAFLTFGAALVAGWMQAPQDAFAETVAYTRICGVGMLFIVAYNVLGSIFRGIGDAKTPLFAAAVACGVNVVCDLLFVGVLGLGAAGAALATVLSHALSVAASILLLRKRKLPFALRRVDFRPDRRCVRMELRLGVPVALQDLLSMTSFSIVQAVINTLGVTASAGVGAAQKVCSFIMLVPTAFLHALSAFVAQNLGANQQNRAKLALRYSILVSFVLAVLMAATAFFRGDLLGAVFSRDPAVIADTQTYLRACAIDCLIVPFLFCFYGYFNGCGRTLFVMVQGIGASFLVRLPIVFFVKTLPNPSLFLFGLATPITSLVQTFLFLFMYCYMNNQQRVGFSGWN